MMNWIVLSSSNPVLILPGRWQGIFMSYDFLQLWSYHHLPIDHSCIFFFFLQQQISQCPQTLVNDWQLPGNTLDYATLGQHCALLNFDRPIVILRSKPCIFFRYVSNVSYYSEIVFWTSNASRIQKCIVGICVQRSIMVDRFMCLICTFGKEDLETY